MPVCVAGAVLCLCACFKGLQVLGVCCAGCHCVRLSVCLWCLRCACGAPCCAVGVCVAGFACVVLQVLRCGLRLCAALWWQGVVLSIKSTTYSDF